MCVCVWLYLCALARRARRPNTKYATDNTKLANKTPLSIKRLILHPLLQTSSQLQCAPIFRPPRTCCQNARSGGHAQRCTGALVACRWHRASQRKRSLRALLNTYNRITTIYSRPACGDKTIRRARALVRFWGGKVQVGFYGLQRNGLAAQRHDYYKFIEFSTSSTIVHMRTYAEWSAEVQRGLPMLLLLLFA